MGEPMSLQQKNVWGSSYTVYYGYLGGLPSPFAIMPPHFLQFCVYLYCSETVNYE
jgi:hypothetical protein